MRVAGSALAVVAFVAVAGNVTPAAAVPQQLQGKTIIVNWQEQREQKNVGDNEVRQVGAFAEFDVYVSEAGRTFSRLRFTVANRKGKLKTGAADAVGSGGGSARNISFSGNSMTASMPRGAGGAIGIMVTFDSGFQSCTARTISGKSSGVEAARGRSLINGKAIDMISVKTSGESCKIQAGNMFAN